MLVLNMNSKRQRRPNVRLGEIGDFGAAVAACGVSHVNNENLGHFNWGYDLLNFNVESEYEHIRRSFECTFSPPGVSQVIAADLQQNRENKNSNSMKCTLELPSSDDIDQRKCTLDFGTVIPKSRRSTRGRPRAFGSPWNSMIGAEFSCGDGEEYVKQGGFVFASNPCFDLYHANGVNDSHHHESSAMVKEGCESGSYTSASSMRKMDASCSEDNNVFSGTFDTEDTIEDRRSDVNCVTRWLVELGFGKYARAFKQHEVDEEALFLLTFEDLKEMGVLAIGSRRKLYTAIQQLRDSGRVSACN